MFYQQPTNPRKSARQDRRAMSVKDRRAGRRASGLSMQDYKKGKPGAKSALTGGALPMPDYQKMTSQMGYNKAQANYTNNAAIFDTLDPKNNSAQRSNKLGY